MLKLKLIDSKHEPIIWRNDRFDNFIRLNRGFDLPENRIEEGPFPVIASTSIKAYHKAYKISPPAVVTGRSGSLGKVQYVKTNCWPLNTTLFVKDFKGNYPSFVYYFLQVMGLENFNSGAGVPTLNQNHLHRLKILIPPIPIQQKIASVLSAYDELIENNNRRILLLEQMAEQIYKEWFVRFRFPGYENAEFEKGIPRSWEVVKISGLGKVKTGKTPNTLNTQFYGGKYKFVKTPDMHGNTFILSTADTLSEDGINSQNQLLIPANSILVSCIGTAGIVSISTEACMTNQQINSIILHDFNYVEYVYYVCRSMKNKIEMFGSTGATMTNLSKRKFENLTFIKPDYGYILQFSKLIKPIFAEILYLMKKKEFLIKSRDSLLPRLLSGKLNVENIREP